MKKIISGLAGLALVAGLAVVPATAAQATPEPTRVGVTQVAPSWYVSNYCRYPYRGTVQHYWWNWFQTRTVCAKSGERVPLWYW